MLSVSRAFGDIPFKTRKQQMLDDGIAERRWTKSFANQRNLNGEWLIAAPDTSSLVDEDAEFLILASDGLWDSLKSGEAVDFVRKQLKLHGDVQRASEEIGQEALNRGGQDNVSVIIINFGRIQVEGEQEPGWKFW
jgi:serine/threonine protein phosphatase PrpC